MKFNLPLLTEKKISTDSIPAFIVEIVEALTNIAKGGLTARENMTTALVSAQLKPGAEQIIQHGLKNTPSLIQLTSGRVECFVASKQGDQSFTVLAKLLSTRAVATVSGFSDRMEVEDATLFKVKDTILIGETARTIVNIQSRTLTLNQNLLLGDPVPVTLATETCSFFLM